MMIRKIKGEDTLTQQNQTVAFHTLGCKVNQYDTQAMRERFEAAGYQTVDFDGPADVYVVNTCTVTGTGDKKSMQTIRRCHRQNPAAQIVVTGCLGAARRFGAHAAGACAWCWAPSGAARWWSCCTGQWSRSARWSRWRRCARRPLST